MLSVKIPGSRVFYLAGAVLMDCEFKVHEHGRQRCIRDGQRNVHAWVVGRMLAASVTPYDTSRGLNVAVYDPWKGSTFVDAHTHEPVLHSSYVIMRGKDVFYRKD